VPEGHTLHRLATEITDAFAGNPVRVSSPQGRFDREATQLDGSTLLVAESAGKHLFLDFDADRIVHVHLGLIGGFDIHRDVTEVPSPVGQVRLRLVGGGGHPAYADLRGATQCALVTDPDKAWARISRSPRAIGDLLMDQAVLAGVGNVYRAEVLFRHRIHPLRPGRTLRVGQWRAIWADLVELMAEGVRTGRIDTVRPEHTPEAMGRAPRVDDHGGEVYVYRRTGQPCLVCGTTIRTDVLVGRNIFWCPQCQRKFRSRALQ
jgi:endonuclease VIII